MEEKQNIKKEYKPKLVDNDIVNFSNKFVDDFFLDKENRDPNQMPINAIKIIVNILQTIRSEQFMLPQTGQLKLFEDEFLTEHNTYAKVKIKNSKISTNKDHIENAYLALAQYKFGWYESTNSQGKSVKSLGGLISNVSYSEKGYTTFLISSYWLEKLLNLSEGYNRVLHALPYKTKSTRYIIFCFWLEKLKEDTGSVTLTYMNELFGTNYKTATDFGKFFLKPIKMFLDKNSLNSFNFKTRENKIYYNRYKLKTLNTTITTKETQEEQLQVYKISYYKKRHKLNKEQTQRLNPKNSSTLSFYLLESKYRNNNSSKLYKEEMKEIEKGILQKYMQAYENLKKQKEKKLTEYIGEEFMDALQTEIDKIYKKKPATFDNRPKITKK